MRPPPQSVVGGLSVDREALAWLADLARLAYRDRAVIADNLGDLPGFIRFSFFDADGTQAFLAEFHRFQVLAFRGTEITSPKDILTDLRFAQTPMKTDVGGKVHSGFLAATEAVIGDVSKALTPGKPIYLTGHSLGGALAVIAAAILAGPFNMRARLIVGVVTYGCPRVGNCAFVHGLTALAGIPLDRVTNTADIVPWLPLLVLRYRHKGMHHHLTASGRLLFNPGFWRSFASLVMALVPGLLHAKSWRHRLPVRLFTDHEMDRYVDKLTVATNPAVVRGARLFVGGKEWIVSGVYRAALDDPTMLVGLQDAANDAPRREYILPPEFVNAIGQGKVAINE
ncbi:MAG: hypothetical protein CMM61_13570 [Rhodospirillaceae bacterium]|nr:hypothetical protein [Rhodospirillaceae bacterium]